MLRSKIISGSQEDDMSIRKVCESPEPLFSLTLYGRGFVKKWGARDREVFEFPFSKTGNERGSLGSLTEIAFQLLMRQLLQRRKLRVLKSTS